MYENNIVHLVKKGKLTSGFIDIVFFMLRMLSCLIRSMSLYPRPSKQQKKKRSSVFIMDILLEKMFKFLIALLEIPIKVTQSNFIIKICQKCSQLTHYKI